MQDAPYIDGPPELDPGFGHWLAGFIDGEGCFYISRHPRGALSCRLTVKLRADDAATLEYIARTTSIGRVAEYKTGFDGRRGCPQVYWQALRRAHCLWLVTLFDRYPLRSKKARDYAIWREAVFMWAAIIPANRGGVAAAHRHNRPIWDRMAALKDDLVAVRVYR